MADFRLPDMTNRLTIMGRTGSGKTRLGAWVLSKMPFHKIPYVIIDHKREKLFARSALIKEIGPREIPHFPGLYIMRPDVRDDNHDATLDAYFSDVLDAENCGNYIDEGYSIKPHSKAFRALLTQGRSKNCPVITLSQRPALISRFAFTEADFFSIFQLSLEDDRKTAQSYAPKNRIDLDKSLPPFHSHWYDVAQDSVHTLAPVPSDDEILNEIETRLAPKRKAL